MAQELFSKQELMIRLQRIREKKKKEEKEIDEFFRELNLESEKRTPEINAESGILDREKLRGIWESVKNEDFEKRKGENQGISNEENSKNPDFSERKDYSVSELIKEQQELIHIERLIYGNPLQKPEESNTSPSVKPIKKQKRKENKLIVKAKFNIISERGVNMLLLPSLRKRPNQKKIFVFKGEEYTVEIEGYWGWKNSMLLDVIGHKFMTEREGQFLKERVLLFENREEVGPKIKIMKTFEKEDFPLVEFTDDEFRDLTQRSFSTKEIYDIVTSTAKVFIKAMWPVYDPQRNEFFLYEIGSSFFSYFCEELGSVFPRWKDPKFARKRKYQIIFSTPGSWIFLQNLLAHQFDYYNPVLYQCSPATQNLYRGISYYDVEPWESLDSLARKAGYDLSQPVENKKKYVEKALKELKEKELIEGWKKKGKGRNTLYHIQKIRKRTLPKPETSRK